MEKQPVNGVSPTMNGNSKRLPSYSVETPYGFHLDLDFLKYVDDIEKGNTIRRVPVQRRNRPASASALVHNRSLPGYGRLHGASQWSSIGSLWPKSRTVDSGCGRHPSTPHSRALTTAQLEEERAFDEQPLGLYVRPNLLRTSSLPATVLQRKRSESNDDPTSPGGSRDHLLLPGNGSSDDVFSDSGRHGMHGGPVNSGMLLRLTGALQRVGELEEEIRVIPELKAQICNLQEERERLLMRLHSDPPTSSTTPPPGLATNGQQQQQPQQRSSTGISAEWGNGHSSGRGSSTLEEEQEEDWMSRELKRLEEKVNASSVQVETEALLSSVRDGGGGGGRGMRGSGLSPRPEQQQQQQPVEALQRKVASLEQRLRQSQTELQTTKTMLQNQATESRLKDERIEELSCSTPDIWVKTEISEQQQQQQQPKQQEGWTTNGHVSESTSKELRVAAEGDSRQEADAPADVSHHVGRVRTLLQEQWECLLSGRQAVDGVPAGQHLPPRASCIQEELMRLVDSLASYVGPGQRSGTDSKLLASISTLREGDVVKNEAISSAGFNHSGPPDWEEAGIVVGASHSLEETMASKAPEKIKHLRAEESPEEETKGDQDPQIQPKSQTESAHSAAQPGKTERQPNSDGQQGRLEQREEPGMGVRGVDDAFIAACLYLKDHMDEITNLNDEMRQALTVVFQQWFQVAAEEDSSTQVVALHLGRVKAEAPSLLQFLVNLADDNGNTALHYSVSHSNFSIVRMLLDTGVCDVDMRNKAGFTAIMLAALTATSSPQDLEVVRQLLQTGDVNVQAGQAGQTALHLAARHGRRLIVPLLLAVGADANAQDHAGSTALMLACERDHCDIAAILLQQADCNTALTDREGRSALSIALAASYANLANLLQERMAS
ncbi:KN motif and ankyrin repeat domain-containing protein 2-like isoform X2 [Engraulis encrasicolus]|uniref:KN motif and ankyrin repeat domain-containing protein 2-like isoform X2 n=1 Tax=Engraulis encrasicolus TaxID=184585 RepID=UPI002FD0CB48